MSTETRTNGSEGSEQPALPGMDKSVSNAINPSSGLQTLELKLPELTITLTWASRPARSKDGDGEGEPGSTQGGSGTPKP